MKMTAVTNKSACSVALLLHARKLVQFLYSNTKDPGFDSRRYQIFWEVVGLERAPLSLVSIA
jgi:hypothetical protein